MLVLCSMALVHTRCAYQLRKLDSRECRSPLRMICIIQTQRYPHLETLTSIMCVHGVHLHELSVIGLSYRKYGLGHDLMGVFYTGFETQQQ